jgi:hypothetical protein
MSIDISGKRTRPAEAFVPSPFMGRQIGMVRKGRMGEEDDDEAIASTTTPSPNPDIRRFLRPFAIVVRHWGGCTPLIEEDPIGHRLLLTRTWKQ